MPSYLRRLLMLVLAASFVCGAFALDLPVKRVNGRQYYYYKVRNKETVYGVSRKLGVSREEIVRYNPSMADGLKRGAILYFPVDEFADRTSENSADPDSVIETPVPEVPVNVREPLITIALPFAPEASEPSRQNRHALDFYKGLLIAADTLADFHGEIRIQAIDYTGITSLSDSLMMRTAVLIGPEDDTSCAALADLCLSNSTYLLNLFNVRDTTYMHNPYVLQANIPAEMMYEKAVDALFTDFGDFMPVIIRNNSGRNEKDPFTACLERRCEAEGREFTRIDYEGALLSTELAAIDAQGNRNMVIVPSSGTLAEFNRFAHVVKNFRDSHNVRPEAESEEPATGNVAVFGYPDWIAFRGEAEELLHQLEATIYSRFYDDYMSFTSRNIASDFRQWYGSEMMETVPSQALLGYDAGTYAIKNIRANNGTMRPEYPSVFNGVQSTFKFECVPGGGFVNTALYIVKYLPAGRMSARVL